jgi:ABC-2 type transport system permease protein
MRGLWKLTWLELKIFAREPLGLLGSILIPVAMFLIIGRSVAGSGRRGAPAPETAQFIVLTLPVLASILIALSAVLSLVTIIAIYREGGILKRLRATPLRPATILSAHVVVKLLMTVITMSLLVLAGKRYYPVELDLPFVSLLSALLLSTLSILSMGFVIASLVPTARFAQPVGALLFYPMIALSGLFVPVAALPPGLRGVARLLPLTYVVSFLSGVLRGEGWRAHLGDVGVLLVVLIAGVAICSKVFRWE